MCCKTHSISTRTLQELSELLSISTEDSLAGSFQVESFVRELVRILGGTGEATNSDRDDEDDGDDEDSALAAALAMSARHSVKINLRHSPIAVCDSQLWTKYAGEHCETHW